MSTWKTIKKNVVLSNQWMRIFQDDVIDPSGDETTYTYIERGSGVGLWLVKNNKLILETQYRYPIKRSIYQIPLETLKKGEKWEDAAHRCAKEELGCIGKNIKFLGKSFVDPGVSNQELYFFQADFDREIERELDSSEMDMRLSEFSLEEIDEMVGKGEIVDYSTLAGLYLFKLRNRL